ncbi:Phi92_gp217 [Escherichia phage phi92]|uniref:Phi92_gp217 n=1 Tax=Escherichia phage phi92 TaxID=948870 RepID=I7HPI2_9CAUD|nr:Phi92_gp217 [Escherichia phage phi92]CBY99646.1 Phi92_gp217 [Escherichia phage phi92]
MQNIDLTWIEAKEAMLKGKRVKHKYFCEGEWFEMRNRSLVDEKGNDMGQWFKNEIWQGTGWSIVEEQPSPSALFSPIMYRVIGALVVDHGIAVEKECWEEVSFFNLASYAKSHMHLFEEGDEFVLRMRYGKEFRLPLDNDVDTVVKWLAEHYAYDAICGRSFGNERWDMICEKYDFEPEYGVL